MNKKTKWGIIILVGAGIIGGGIYSQLPKKNDELAAADKVMGSNKKRGKQVLNVNAKVIKPQSLTDEFTTTGVLLPDEEVDLSFETSGKIVEINFEEGTAVKKGQLLAKVNDRQLQAQLQRLISQLKLAEDRVFRQDALLKRDAVSKEAYEQVKGNTEGKNADYIPYLAKNAGFKKIGEKVVHHQARKYGKTKFGLNRFVNGYLDLLSLWFLSRFGIKPMHFFGLLGSLMFIFGFIAVVIVGVSKLYYMHHGMPYRLVTDSPYFYLSLTSMIIGTQLFVAGFLGELISRNAPERNKYQIEKTI